jgi:hypothetical protein
MVSAIVLLTFLRMTEKPPRALIAGAFKKGGKTGFSGTAYQPRALATRTSNESREMRKYRSKWRLSSQNHYI